MDKLTTNLNNKINNMKEEFRKFSVSVEDKVIRAPKEDVTAENNLLLDDVKKTYN